MSRSQLLNNNSTRVFDSNNTSPIKQGRVYSVITDKNHFFYKKVLGFFDPTYLGSIYWGDVTLREAPSEEANAIINYCTLAKPYFNFLTYPPLINEIVNVILAPSNNHYIDLGGSTRNIEYYYYPALNVWNNSSYNALPPDITFDPTNPDVLLGEYTKEDTLKSIKNLKSFEGDMILEGRFGNSIRFGSSNPRGKNNWSESEGEGDPIMIISNGQTPTDTRGPILEDINGDASSIYLTSNHTINNLNLSCNNFTSLQLDFKPKQGLLNFPSQGLTGDEFINPSIPDEFTEGNNFPLQGGDEGGDGASHGEDEEIIQQENEFINEDFVKIPGQYKLNDGKSYTLYKVPKRYSRGRETILVTKVLAENLGKLLEAADNDGVRIRLNSGVRPPYEDVYLNNKKIQNSQKTIRLNSLLPEFRGKLKEPWKYKTTATSNFTHPFTGEFIKIGDSVELGKQASFFGKSVAPAGSSPHGRSEAIDIQSAGGTNSAYTWLCNNGWKYGYIRTVYDEPWHFEYRPELAKNGPTAKLSYTYKADHNPSSNNYTDTVNSWQNVFGSQEPNWLEQQA